MKLPRGSGRRARWSGSSGTTLLEIVITVAIMTIGMLGYFTLHIRSFQVSGSALTMTQATSLTSALQDQLLAIPYTPPYLAPSVQPDAINPAKCAPPSTPDSLTDLPCPLVNYYVDAEGNKQSNGPFYRSYAVTQVPDANPEQLEITVRVRYRAEDGRCPGCSTYKSGYKSVTTRIIRTRSAY